MTEEQITASEEPVTRASSTETEPLSMLQWAPVETTHVGTSEFVLARYEDDWVVRVNQRVLMSNRMHDSEISLAEHGLERADEPRHILVGGLGLGYTLRAVLDIVPDDAMVTVAELVPDLVEWNRKYLGGLNDHPLEDPRAHVVVGDVFELLKRSPRTFDVILLDVDNGPQALAQAKNQRLYGDAGVRACAAALTQGGVLAVWSAGPNARYTRKLESFGFDVEVMRVDARTGSRAKHVLFLATRS